jgi:hypothetical protein
MLPSNIAASGRRRRTRFGAVMLATSIGMLVASVRLGVPWFWRALVFFPAAGAAMGFLEVRRGTCVLRAAAGTCELEDGSTRPAAEPDARASRQIARTIWRDTILLGLLAAALAAAVR